MTQNIHKSLKITAYTVITASGISLSLTGYHSYMYNTALNLIIQIIPRFFLPLDVDLQRLK